MVTLDRYYYMCLNDNEETAYRTIYSGITSFSPSVLVTGIKEAAIEKILDGILLDNPHLFYLDLRRYTYYKSRSGITLSLSYLCSKPELEHIRRRLEDNVKEILTSMNFENMTDYQKEMYIHDFLCQNVQYDYQCGTGKTLNMTAHTIWGVFLEKKAVCDGISKAFKYLCNALGIKCIVARGRANAGVEEPHAWNIVKIAGEAYHVDVTWDLNRYDGESCSYYYFNLPDEIMLLDHKPDYSYPRCSGTIDMRR